MGSEVTVIISSHLRESVFTIMFWRLVGFQNCDDHTINPQWFLAHLCLWKWKRCTENVPQKIINSRHCLQGQRPVLLHSMTHLSEAPDLILQVDWKLKPRDQDWIRRLLTMSAFYHLHWSQMVFLRAQFDLYLEGKSPWISWFVSLC